MTSGRSLARGRLIFELSNLCRAGISAFRVRPPDSDRADQIRPTAPQRLHSSSTKMDAPNYTPCSPGDAGNDTLDHKLFPDGDPGSSTLGSPLQTLSGSHQGRPNFDESATNGSCAISSLTVINQCTDQITRSGESFSLPTSRAFLTGGGKRPRAFGRPLSRMSHKLLVQETDGKHRLQRTFGRSVRRR
jgi:hypothetical protein